MQKITEKRNRRYQTNAIESFIMSEEPKVQLREEIFYLKGTFADLPCLLDYIAVLSGSSFLLFLLILLQ